MDEQRVGLKPVIRRIWADEFAVPIALVNWRFGVQVPMDADNPYS